MASRTTLLIGARGSPLSLAQTGHVRDALAAANPEIEFVVAPIVTSGDRIQDRALTAVGGKGLFTKELDEGLLAGRIDLAVHSMKDLPTVLPEGVVLGATPRREEPRDALITALPAADLAELPDGARIGTASLRRQAQLLALNPSFRISLLRGNVETRLAKAETGEVDATLLAFAGLRRLGLGHRAQALVDPEDAPPAPGQGALAITARAGDAHVLGALARIDDGVCGREIAAERAFLKALDGSCRTPIAALARASGDDLVFIGEALTPDGVRRWRRRAQAVCADAAAAAALGEALGRSLKAEAGDELYVDVDA
jgi:hydroxymethylbilane synthase